MLALGFAVSLLRPRTHPQMALAGLAIFTGSAQAARNILSPSDPAYLAMVDVQGILLVGAGACAFWLGATFPRRLPRRLTAAPAIVAGVSFAAHVLVSLLDTTWERGFHALTLGSSFNRAGMAFTLIAVLLRAVEGAPLRPLALLTTAFVVNYGADVGRSLFLPRGIMVYAAPVGFVVLLAVTALWLWATMRVAPEDRRIARNVALAIPFVVLASASIAAFATGHWIELGVNGIGRLAMAVILTYAILQHRLLGIDVKLRWTLSRSSVAAAFVAVFFVVSEAAQQFFGDAFESGYLGIVAAGALVFAIAPLSRLADRLAERAIPVASPADAPGSPGVPPSRREEAYRRALRLALRDRAVSREEEVHLHEVAEHMGIGAGRAMALRVEVERELRGEGAPEGHG